MHDIEEMARRARALMDELGARLGGAPLHQLGWTFGFDRARTRLGLCTWRAGRTRVRRISLSRPLSERLGWAIMEDVVRHEIAHALDYEARGRSAHDARWRSWALRCGADPTATYDGPIGDDPNSPFVGECPSGECGYRRPLYRVPVRVPVCMECRNRGQARPLAVYSRESGRPVAVGAAAAPWVGTCPGCASRIAFARRPNGRRACAACCRGAGGRFDARFVLHIARRH